MIYKLVYYTTGEEYETTQLYIDEPTFRQIQKAYSNDNKTIALPDRIIKKSLIAEVSPAGEEVAEYQKMGFSAKRLGIKEYPKLEEQKKKKKLSGIKDKLTDKMKMLSNKDRYAKLSIQEKKYEQ